MKDEQIFVNKIIGSILYIRSAKFCIWVKENNVIANIIMKVKGTKYKEEIYLLVNYLKSNCSYICGRLSRNSLTVQIDPFSSHIARCKESRLSLVICHMMT